MTDQSVTTRKARRPEERRPEILAAALDLFAEKGFSATRLEDVASRAGLSKAAIYLYFKDKASLLTAVVQAAVGARLDMAQAVVAAHQGPVAPLFAELLALLAREVGHSRLPDIIKLVIGESRAHPEIGRAYLENVIKRALPLFQGLIERGIAAGEFRAVDTRLAVKCLVAPMLLGALWRSVFEPIGAEPLDIEALARQHADIFLKGLRP
jgi:AcrR family transcriptional regulator